MPIRPPRVPVAADLAWAAALRAAMDAAGESPAAMARRYGVSRQAVAAWRHGRAFPAPRILSDLAARYGTEPPPRRPVGRPPVSRAPEPGR